MPLLPRPRRRLHRRLARPLRTLLTRLRARSLLPLLLGSLIHMVLCEQEYTASFGVLRDLWQDGVALKSGGAISGVLANGSVAVFSKVASLILFTGLFVALSMIALRLTLGTIAGWRQNLPAYEEEPEKPAIRVTPVEKPRRRAEARPKQQIDIPLVLHGGSGLPRETVWKAITVAGGGVSKINIATDLEQVFLGSLGCGRKTNKEIWQMDLPRTFRCDFEEYQNDCMDQAEIHIYVGLK